MPDRPNVLFVLCDQLRAETVGCLGNDQVATPTIDRLADEGALFERAYPPSPGCCPTRGSLLTSQYSHQHGVVNFNVPLPTTADTLSCRLRDGGYETGYIGKWHLDGQANPGRIPPGPRRQGFEFWRGFNRGHRYHDGHPTFDEEGNVEWVGEYQPRVQTDMALDFIGDRAGGEDPFFLMLSWGPPHTPFDAPEEYAAMYDPDDLDLRPNVPEAEDIPDLREDLAEYYGLTTSLDDQLERLLAGLAEHGVEEDTLVVFTSDHGEMLGSHGRYRKGYPHEESVHVPLVARYPERVDAGQTHDQPVSLIDLMPTILSYADAPGPDGMEGVDLTPLLDGESVDPHPEGVYMQNDIAFDSAWRALRTDQYMVTVDRDLQVRYLYDMTTDPHQQENLAGDPDHADLQEDLFDAVIEAAERHADSTFWSRWYKQEVLGNPLDAHPTLYGEYEDLPGEPPHYEP
jgi:arylsulfatase A-like enzyme